MTVRLSSPPDERAQWDGSVEQGQQVWSELTADRAMQNDKYPWSFNAPSTVLTSEGGGLFLIQRKFELFMEGKK